MKWNLGRSSKGLLGRLALMLGLGLLAAVSANSREKQKAAGTPVAENVSWETLLIKGEPQPTFRFAVAHQHAASGCYGYLYVSRDEVWYEVKSPATDSDHGFRYPRSTVTEARQWRFMGSTMPEVEFKFSGGKTYHFFRVRESLLEQPSLTSKSLKWEDIRSWEPLAQAVEDFDATVRMAEERQNALAPKPVPALTLSATPNTVEKGQGLTLTWTSSNATSLDLEPGIGQVQANGSREVVPTESTTYVISALGPGGGNTATAHVTVNAPAAPPTIVLVEPSVTNSGATLELATSPLTIRGVAMDSSGIPVVTINGTPAALRPKSTQAAEFSSDPIVLQPGENRFEITATNAARAEAKVIFVARYKTTAPQPATQTNAKALAKAEILDLLKGEVPSARVASLVKERGVKWTPTEDDIKEIRAAGGGDDLVEALKQSMASPKQ